MNRSFAGALPVVVAATQMAAKPVAAASVSAREGLKEGQSPLLIVVEYLSVGLSVNRRPESMVEPHEPAQRPLPFAPAGIHHFQVLVRIEKCGGKPGRGVYHRIGGLGL